MFSNQFALLVRIHRVSNEFRELKTCFERCWCKFDHGQCIVNAGQTWSNPFSFIFLWLEISHFFPIFEYSTIFTLFLKFQALGDYVEQGFFMDFIG